MQGPINVSASDQQLREATHLDVSISGKALAVDRESGQVYGVVAKAVRTGRKIKFPLGERDEFKNMWVFAHDHSPVNREAYYIWHVS